MAVANGCLFVATAALVALQPAQADLGAALRRQASHTSGAAVSHTPSSSPIIVPLEKVSPRNVSIGHQHSRDGFYVGKVSIGSPPQHMKVLFDTSFGHVLLSHRACKSPACVEHQRYSPWESSTAQYVNPDGHTVIPRVNRKVVTIGVTQSDLGEGWARGVFVRDDVCLGSGAKGSQACAKVAVVAALHEDDAPFRAMPHDGIVGLGFPGLSAGALSSFCERLLDSSHGLLPHFALHLGPRGGELVFGGHDPARLSGPIQWVPVVRPEDGFWQVRIAAVRVGNVTVDACEHGCRGVIDTGAASLGVSKAQLGNLLRSLTPARSPDGACEGPVLQLDLGGSSLELLAEDYTGTSCQPELGALGEDPLFAGVYVLGTTALHRRYTAFDWAEGRVGFAGLAPQHAAVQRATAAQLTGVMVV